MLVLSPSADARKKKRRYSRIGYLSIESMTDDARVYIDGKFIGKTPFEKRIKIKAGKHQLKATKPGFMSSEMPFEIRRRRTTNLTVDLLPSSGIAKFDCNIKGAEVYLDGTLLGNTPLIKDVPLGNHVVTITKESYNDFTTQLLVKAGEKAFVNGKLTPFKNFTPEALAVRKAKEEKEKREAELRAQLQATPVEPASGVHWYDDWYEKWWFWTAVGVVVITSVAVPVAATSGGPQSGLNDHTSPIDPITLP